MKVEGKEYTFLHKQILHNKPWEPLTPQCSWRTGSEHRVNAPEEETSRLAFTLYQCFTRTTLISLLLSAFLPAEDQAASLKHRRLPRVDKGIKFISLLTQLHLALHVPYTRHHSSLLHTPLYQKGQSLQGNLCNSLRNPEVPAILGLFSNLTKGTRDLTLTAPPASTQSSKLSK